MSKSKEDILKGIPEYGVKSSKDILAGIPEYEGKSSKAILDNMPDWTPPAEQPPVQTPEIITEPLQRPTSPMAETPQLTPEEMDKTPFSEKLLKGYGTGVGGMLKGTGGSLKWVGFDKLGKKVSDYGNTMLKFYEVPDPDFVTSVASGIASASTFLIPGMGIAKGVKALSTVPRLAAWLGISASTAMESMVEAGSGYEEALQNGMTEKEANGVAHKIFWVNLPTTAITNRLGFFGKDGGAILKGLKSAPAEGIQEFTQQLISNFALKDPLFKGAIESAAVGTIVGGGLGAVIGGAESMQQKKETPGQEEVLPQTPEIKPTVPGIAPQPTEQPVLPEVKAEVAKTPEVAKPPIETKPEPVIEPVVEPVSKPTPTKPESLEVEARKPEIEPIVKEAIKNTEGAKITNNGIEIDISRYQKEEQFGEPSIRTGVFYLPEGKSPYGKYYSTGKYGYGGGKKITGRTTIKNPIIVKAGTGGKGVEKAYDIIKGKGSYGKMRSDVLAKSWTKEMNRKPDMEAIEKLLEKYEGSPELAWNIVEYSKGGNLLAYAIQEHIVAHAVRKAGYDAILSHSTSNKNPRLSEVFDVRAMDYPTETATYEYPEFYKSHKSEVKGEGRPEVVTPPAEKGKPTGKGAEVRKRVRKITGQSKVSEVIEMTERQLLKGQLRAEARASRKGFIEGKEVGREKAMGIFKERVKTGRESQKKKKEIEKSVKTINRLSKIKGGLNETIDFNYAEKIKEIAKKFDLKNRTQKTLVSRFKTEEFITKEIESGHTISIPQKTIDMIEKRPLNDITVDELKGVAQTIKQLAHLGRNKNKMIKLQKGRSVDSKAEEIKKSIIGDKKITVLDERNTGVKKRTWKENAIRKASSILREQRQIENLATVSKEDKTIVDDVVAGAYNMEQSLYRNVYQPLNLGYNKYEVGVRTKIKDVKGNLKGLIGKQKVFFNDKIKINENVEMTSAEKVEAYMATLRDVKLDHLMRGNKYNEKDISDIVKSVTPKEKKIADYILSVYESYYPLINEIHMKTQGVPLPKDQFYSEIVISFEDTARNFGKIEDILGEEHLLRGKVKKGFTKTAFGGTGKLRLTPIQNLLEHIDKAEKYIAFGEIERDVNVLISHPLVKGSIIQKSGEDTYTDLVHWFDDVIGRKYDMDYAGTTQFMGKLKSNAVIAMLGGNLTTAIRQGMSLPTGMAYIRPDMVMKGIWDYARHPLKITKLMNEKFPHYQYRFADQDIKAVEKQMNLNPDLRTKIGRVGMAPLGFIDKLTVRTLAYSAYKELIKRGVSESKAIETADYAIQKSQPMSRPVDLPKLYKGKSDLFKAMITFTNQLNQSGNAVYDNIKWVGKGTTSPQRAAWGGLAIMTIPALLMGISKRGRAPTPKELLADIATYPIAFVPFGREISTIVSNHITGEYNPFQTDVMPIPLVGVEEFLKTVSSKDLKKAAQHGLMTLAYLNGIPAAQPKRTISGAADLISGKTDDLRRLIWSEWALKEPKDKPESGFKTNALKSTGFEKTKLKTKKW